MNVLVTAAGSGVGQALIKCLRVAGHIDRIVAVDPQERAAGFRMNGVSARYLVPYAQDPQYLDDVLAICNKEHIDLVFPGSDPELAPLSLIGMVLRRDNVCRVVSCRAEVINVAQDKLQCAEILRQAGISTAETLRISDGKSLTWFAGQHLPIVVKPRRGSNSYGVSILRDRHEVGAWLEEWSLAPKGEEEEMIAQEYLEGPEFTATAVVGKLKGSRGILDCMALVREPRLGPKQDFIVRWCSDNPAVLDVLSGVIRVLAWHHPEGMGVYGGINVQGRIVPGRGPVVFEVNPRFPGSVSVCQVFGMNGPALIAAEYAPIDLDGVKQKHKVGWSCHRILEEVWAPPSEPIRFVGHHPTDGQKVEPSEPTSAP